MADLEKRESNSVPRNAAINMSPEQFRQIGHSLVDRIAEFLQSIPLRPVTPAESPEEVRKLIGGPRPLPEGGSDPQVLVKQAADLLFNHSLLNGHPRFWGYITSAPAPIGMLADMLAASVNPNVGAWVLSPLATEIEAQTVSWIAELIGYPTPCGGLLVSGGNMANFVGFLAARRAKATWDIRKEGISAELNRRLRVYTSAETHTWLEKATDLFGLGTDAIVWIPTDAQRRVNTKLLREQIVRDREAGMLPFMVVGTAGSVSTGAVDPLFELAELCNEFDLWFHVDAAYGGCAARVKGVPADLAGLAKADSVAIDPHKWLYSPLEAGCALVRRSEELTGTFSYRPPYYHMDTKLTNYVDYGMQNSRGFRALKVWLALQQVGREGYMEMIGEDIRLAELLFAEVKTVRQLEAFTCGLSIATFRYVPDDLRERRSQPEVRQYLNKLNEEIMVALEQSGQAFVSQAIIEDCLTLRACIVNFRTSEFDVRSLPALICRIGQSVDQKVRPEHGARL